MMALMYGPLVYIIMQHDGPLMVLGVAHCAHHASCTNVLLILAATTMLVEQCIMLHLNISSRYLQCTGGDLLAHNR